MVLWIVEFTMDVVTDAFRYSCIYMNEIKINENRSISF